MLQNCAAFIRIGQDTGMNGGSVGCVRLPFALILATMAPGAVMTQGVVKVTLPSDTDIA